MPSLLILIPLLALLLLNIIPYKTAKRLASPAVLLLILAQAAAVIAFPASDWLPGAASLFSFHLEVDALTRLMLLSISLVAFAGLFVAGETLHDSYKRFDFLNLLLLIVTGMNGLVLVRDLFSLYVFLEIVAVSSFILIALHRDQNGLEGSFKYLLLSALATLMMLSSIALLLLTAGDTSFAAVAAQLKAGPATTPVLLASALFLGGLFIKGGLVPFHGWLPDAYSSAPASVSVVLAGIVTKATGVYTLIRLVTGVFGFTPALTNLVLIVGAVSVLVGAIAALSQKDMKRMLAYSSISQVGYILLGLGAGTPLGVAAAAFHLFNHSIFKTQLFVNAAAVEEQTGTRDMDRMGGLTARMPVTGTTSVIGFLSTAGIPPLSGFWSKLVIVVALWTANRQGYAVLAVMASVLTIAYFLSMQRRVFFGKLAEEWKDLKEAKAALLVPALVLALLSIGIGVCFPCVLDSFILPVASIFG